MKEIVPGLLFDETYQKRIEQRLYAMAVEKSAMGRKIVGLYS